MESYVGEECMQVWWDRGPPSTSRPRGRWIALFGLHKWDTSASIDSEDVVLFADLCVFCLVGEAEETEKKVLPWRKLRTRVWLQVRQRLWRGRPEEFEMAAGCQNGGCKCGSNCTYDPCNCKRDTARVRRGRHTAFLLSFVLSP
ncbi:unnamed protein product [Musa acuminata var. zebrina]